MRKEFRSGFSLVEVTLALGIAAFCLIAVFGLMPIGVQTNRNATSQTAATNIMAAVVSDLRATLTNTSSQFGITFGTNKTLYFDGTGQFTTSLSTNARYQLNLTWPSSGRNGLSYADLKVTWPPTVVITSPTPVPSGSAEMFVAFDRN